MRRAQRWPTSPPSAGVDPFDALCEIVVADDLHDRLLVPAERRHRRRLGGAVDVWRDQRSVLGASDAGAHLDFLATFNYPTVMLRRAVRRPRAAAVGGGDRAAHRRAGPPLRAARPWPARRGLGRRRGPRPRSHRAAPDARRASTCPATAGASTARPTASTTCSSTAWRSVVDGKATDARPGHVLRSGRDTYTVRASA